METIENTIGELLRDQGRTQKWLSEQVGKGPVMINLYCQNKKQPTITTAYLIAQKLNVTLNDLVRIIE